MGIESTAETWLASVALRKVAVHVVNIAVAWLLAHGACAFLAQYGIPIDPTTLQNGLTAMFTAGIKFIRDFLSVKMGWPWLA